MGRFYKLGNTSDAGKLGWAGTRKNLMDRRTDPLGYVGNQRICTLYFQYYFEKKSRSYGFVPIKKTKVSCNWSNYPLVNYYSAGTLEAATPKKNGV